MFKIMRYDDVILEIAAPEQSETTNSAGIRDLGLKLIQHADELDMLSGSDNNPLGPVIPDSYCECSMESLECRGCTCSELNGYS